MLERPFDNNNTGDQALYGDLTHETSTYIAPNDNVGLFFSKDSIILKAGQTSLVIDQNTIYANGMFVQRDFVETTNRSFMTNPVGMLPGTVIPITLPAAFNKLPSPMALMPLIGIGKDAADLIISLLV